jgi:hypothetical protein
MSYVQTVWKATSKKTLGVDLDTKKNQSNERYPMIDRLLIHRLAGFGQHSVTTTTTTITTATITDHETLHFRSATRLHLYDSSRLSGSAEALWRRYQELAGSSFSTGYVTYQAHR